MNWTAGEVVFGPPGGAAPTPPGGRGECGAFEAIARDLRTRIRFLISALPAIGAMAAVAAVAPIDALEPPC